MTEIQRVSALVVRHDEGEVIDVGGVEHLFKLTGQHTGGRFGFEIFSVAPGVVGAVPHVHHAHDEYFFVLDGELTAATGTGEVVLPPDDLAAAPRGSVHGFRNAGEVPVRALCMYTPPGYEQYFRDAHRAVSGGTVMTPELLAELRAKYQTETLP
jgi:mannose-6-phosphate isomerase-like protein (cupin superfamily)